MDGPWSLQLNLPGYVHARIQEFSSGGPGQAEKSSDNVFVFFSPQPILQKLNGQFHRNLSFFKVPEGSNIFQGGPIAFPYRNPYNLWFSKGGGSPSGSALDVK